MAGLVPYWEAVSKASDALYWLGQAVDAPGLPEALAARLAIGTAFFHRLTGDNPARVTALSRRALNPPRVVFRIRSTAVTDRIIVAPSGCRGRNDVDQPDHEQGTA